LAPFRYPTFDIRNLFCYSLFVEIQRLYAPLSLLGLIILAGVAGTLFFHQGRSLDRKPGEDADAAPSVDVPERTHVPLPGEVRALYWTAQTAGTARADELLEYMTETGINAVVIDLKMDDGEIAFEPRDEVLKPFAQDAPTIEDLDALLERIADKHVYRIARIAVMRDDTLATLRPDLALRTPNGTMWHDKIGSVWVDPAAPFVAEYALALAQEAYDRGFDEIQYDYIRFASDGNLSAIRYPSFDQTTSTKADAMNGFYAKIGDPLRAQDIPVSFDLFGMTFISIYDMDIGQTLPGAYPHADFFSPMTYPSHYPNHFRGYDHPALYPYDIVKLTLDEGAAIMQTQFGIAEEETRPRFRPWIQDFDIGAVYTPEMIEDQIRAARDAGASGFLIWNARNVYEPAEYLGDGGGG
jgi:hypothetical protein